MHLTLRETEKLLLHMAGEVAIKRKKRGIKLNYPESMAFYLQPFNGSSPYGQKLTKSMQQRTARTV